MERYYFIKEWELLQNGSHAAIVNFAVSRAKELNVELSICVHNKSSCEQFLNKCFGDTKSNKLLNRQEVSIDGVSLSLESTNTLKHAFVTESKAYLALFPSPDLMEAIEKIDSKASLTVFSETLHSDHLVLWAKNHDAKELNTQ